MLDTIGAYEKNLRQLVEGKQVPFFLVGTFLTYNSLLFS